jgi:type VI secretion system protein ImpL
MNHYPFRNSSTDVALADVEEFFGDGGVLWGSYDRLLAPFVNRNRNFDRASWQGVTVPVSESFINQMRRAQAIRDALFSGGREMGFRFRVKPLQPKVSGAVNPGIIITELQVDGNQVLTYDMGVQRENQFLWPDREASAEAEIRVEVADGIPPQEERRLGEWAWYRLLDLARSSPDPFDKTRTQFVWQLSSPGSYEVDLPYSITVQRNALSRSLFTDFTCPSSTRE